MALVVHFIEIEVGRSEDEPQLVTALVGKGHHGVHRQSAQLRQQHAR